jgi:signal transduction histidine kinase
MRDAIENGSLDQHVAEIVEARRAEILHAYERRLAGSDAADARQAHSRLLEQAAVVLNDVQRRLADTPPAALAHQRRGGTGDDGPGSAQGADGEPSIDSLRASTVLFRTAVQTVADELPPGPDLPRALVSVAVATHEAIVCRLTSASGGYAGFLLDRLHRSHVDERRRVARELHDLIAHSVAVVLQDLELFTVHRDRDPARAEAKLEAALESLRDSLDMLRAITQDLRRSAAESGLTAALRSYVESASFDRPTDLRVVGDEARVPPAVHGELFLVLREALRNAHAHASADAVRALVDIDSDAVRAQVSDDGRGFQPAGGREPPTGSGLASMQERVALLGGTIEVRSAPGDGTTVSVEVPLARAWDESED